MIELYQGDCLHIMQGIESGSIDLILTDPPYGTTACKWDTIIPLEPMWEQLKRIIKPNGAIVLFGSQPFTAALIMSNHKHFCYQWIWNQSRSTGHLNAYKMPMRKHQDINVFSKSGKLPLYFPVITEKKKENIRPQTRRTKLSECYGNHGLDREKHAKIKINQTVPKSVINFNNDQFGQHPTQKPVPLMEYLIKTYTNEGETVLDFTMGSGTTGIACKNLNRNFIGIEKNPQYFKIARKRIKSAEHQLTF